jgi:adenylate cyclase
MRITIRVKIFAAAVCLLLLMVVVANFNTRMAANVGRQLDHIVDEYIPAYAAISDADVRSLELGLALRRLYIAHTATPPDAAMIPVYRKEVADKAREYDADLKAGRAKLIKRMGEANDFEDAVALARLDTRLEIMIEDQKKYGAELARVLSAMEAGDFSGAHNVLLRLDLLRDEIDKRLDDARAAMLELANNAADETLKHQQEVITISLVVMGTSVLLGLIFAGFVSTGVVAPIRRLLSATQAVEGGNLDTNVAVSSRDEIGSLAQAFNRMVGELRVKARIRETFGKYIDPRIVQGLIDRPEFTAPSGERRTMTIFFCDMKGFTSLSEGLTPAGLVNVVNGYLTEMSAPIREHGGIIDKYIGDAIMAFWGMPFNPERDQAKLACLAALGQLRQVEAFRAKLPELMGIKRNLPQIDMRIGIATGDVVVGNIGSDVTKSYTVMGDTVNFASRIEGANKAYGTHILVSKKTARKAAEAVVTREIDSILVVGKTEPQRIFEVLGQKGEVGAETMAARGHYAEGLAAYRRQNWDAAETAFKASIAAVKADPPAEEMLKRIQLVRANPLPAGWNGVWTLAEK